jgi:UDP-N-acetylmuramate--alanine ligase
MKPLACFAHAKGLSVSGCDENLKVLNNQDFCFKTFNNHSINHMDTANVVIYSSAIKENHVEIKTAKERGLCLMHRSEFLAQLSLQYEHSIAVAGTHGKSTTTSILLHILDTLGMRPNGIVGAEFSSSHKGFLCQNSSYFVFEADESDGSLVNYKPHIALINNISFDHPDHFTSIHQTKDVFKKFIDYPSKHGGIVVQWDDEHLRSLCMDMDFTKRVAYGFSFGCDVRILNDFSCKNGISEFKIHFNATTYTIKSKLIGQHNMLNVTAALATCILLELDLKACCESIESFQGVRRRLETRHHTQNKIIIDDYAHNPDKVAASIDAIRLAYPDQSLCLIFEPHRYSRVVSLASSFREALLKADSVLILPVYSAGETVPEGFDIKKLLSDSFHYVKDYEAILNHPNIQTHDILLTMGAGSVHNIIPELIERVKKVSG